MMKKIDITKFFLNGQCEDPAYNNVRDLQHLSQYRSFVEELWGKYKEYAENNFLTEAQKHFSERFWEMYLWTTFCDRGFKIVKQNKRKTQRPDLCLDIAGHTVWIEATAPSAGTTEDRVRDMPYCDNLNEPEAFDVPEEQIILRYTNSLDVKLKQYNNFCEQDIVKPNDSYIIAINGRNIPHAPYGSSLPYFLKAFLPIGNLTVSFDQRTLQASDPYYKHRGHIEKRTEKRFLHSHSWIQSMLEFRQ